MRTSLDRKLILVILGVSTLGLVAACAAFILLDRITFRSQLERSLDHQAAIVGASSVAALDFGDELAAQQGLEGFSEVPDVLSATLFTADGGVLAHYPDATQPLPRGDPGATYDGGALTLVHPIEDGGALIGSLVVRQSLEGERRRRARYLMISGLVLLCALGLSLVAALRFRKGVTAPIRDLTATVHQVAEAKDFAVRVEPPKSNELGQLAVQFNAMLGEIQTRDQALARHRTFLEDQVDARTRELRRANVELVAAKDRAEAVSRLKSTLLDNLSHEFRTPLSGIISLSDILRDDLRDSATLEQEDFLMMIGDSGRRLMESLVMVLDLTQIDGGEYAGQPADHRVDTLLAHTAHDYADRIRGADLHFEIEVEPVVAHVDGQAVQTIVGHLLSNASKFTPDGTVRLEARADASDLVVHVTDTGIGIEPAFLPRASEPFVQSSEGVTRNYEGMGLGLTVVVGLARIIGAQFALRSTVGRGTTALLRLPGVVVSQEVEEVSSDAETENA